MRNQFVCAAALLSALALSPLASGRAVDRRGGGLGDSSSVTFDDAGVLDGAASTSASRGWPHRPSRTAYTPAASSSATPSSSSSSAAADSTPLPYIVPTTGGGSSTIIFPPKKRSAQNYGALDDDSWDDDSYGDVGSISSSVENPGPANEQLQGGASSIDNLQTGTTFEPAFGSDSPVIINERDEKRAIATATLGSGIVAGSISGVTVTFEPAFTTSTKPKPKPSTKSSTKSSTKAATKSTKAPAKPQNTGSVSISGGGGIGSGTNTAKLAGSTVTIDRAKRDVYTVKSKTSSSSSSSATRKPSSAAAPPQPTISDTSSSGSISGSSGGSSFSWTGNQGGSIGSIGSGTTIGKRQGVVVSTIKPSSSVTFFPASGSKPKHSKTKITGGTVISTIGKRQGVVVSTIKPSSSVTFFPASGSKPKHSKTQISGSTIGTTVGKRQGLTEASLHSSTMAFEPADGSASTISKANSDSKISSTLTTP